MSGNFPACSIRIALRSVRLLLGCLLAGVLPGRLHATPADFDLPAQPAATALLAFSAQTGIDVLFSADDLRKVTASAVHGSYEPGDALVHLLAGTGFAARRSARNSYLITRVAPPTGAIRGQVLAPNGTGAAGVQVFLSALRRKTTTDAQGEFQFTAVPTGTYRLVAAAAGYQTAHLGDIHVDADSVRTVEPLTIHPTEEVTRLDPYIVTGETTNLRAIDRSPTSLGPRTATGNLDLNRSQNDALPYLVYDRDQIVRSGVVNLNEFFQREVLDSDAFARPPEQDSTQASFAAGSPNLSLRGFGGDQTVVLINGRRLPEVLTDITSGTRDLGPDVSFIPLSMVQQIQVLPVSASALYSGNAVGGVINIVLRPEAEATEVTTTYTNALRGFDAPQSSVSLLYGRALLGGRLRLRLNATFSKFMPPTEAELGYLRAHPLPSPALDAAIYRATPNVRSADQTPLFGPGTATVTSVAPGADGTGGLAAFAGRAGLRDLDLFNASGGLAASINSLDYPYGRRQQRATYFGSATYDLFPALQLGLDGSYSRTIVHRGYDVLTGDLDLAASSPFNPFGQEVKVSLNETAPQLGKDYDEARLESFAVVGGLLLKLPAEWQVSLDAQYARNVAKYRGLLGADADRWQELVDTGRYNPLRDTQVHGPPPDFYDQVLVHYGEPGQFVTLGDYDTIDAALRITKPSVPLPTGRGTVSLGGDYRRSQLAPYDENFRFADGTLARDPVIWTGRTLQRLSAFGELQAPLLPAARLPRWLTELTADLSVRYVAADTSKETNVAPTFAFKAGFPGGFAVRGSVSTSNRFPTPQMSRPTSLPTGGGGTGGGGLDLTPIFDPVRNESYDVLVSVATDPDLHAEAALTQTAGLIWQRGTVHQFRVSVDFADTRKTNELGTLDAQPLINLESFFPGRVVRAAKTAGDAHSAGVITEVLTGSVNLAERHSQNWNTSVDYAWSQCAGGTLELYGRFAYFQRYDLRLLPDSPLVDELGVPDGAAPSLLRYRANFGGGWSNRVFGFGLDGHYYGSRRLPEVEWAAQGSELIKNYWQFDAYVQRDLTAWLPAKLTRTNGHAGFHLRGQLRVNNLSGFGFPKYVNDSSGAGVEPYGDWRGRTYSLSLTATF